MDELGYDAEWQVFNAKDFGIPQNRERIFLVGHLRGHSGRKVFPILNDGGKDTPSLNELTKAVSQTQRVYGTDGLSPTLRHGSEVTGLIAPMVQVDGLRELTHGVADAHRVYDGDGIARTLKAEGGGSTPGIFVPYETRIRRLTPLECWRLMGREDWEFQRAKDADVSDSQLYKQAGNSLVPQIVTAIARGFEP